MIMCSNCKKRPAVVFITSVQGNEKKTRDFVFSCARERNIPQVAEYMDKLGISNEEVDQLSDQMMDMLDGDSFEMGGSGLMPNFLSNMFGISSSGEEESEDVSEKKQPAKENSSSSGNNQESGGKRDFSRERIKNQKSLNSLEHTVLTLPRKQPTASLIILSEEIRK